MENTVSPYTLLGAPNETPAKDSPVLRCRTALPFEACVANGLERRATVIEFSARNVNIVKLLDSILQERVKVVTDITGRT